MTAESLERGIRRRDTPERIRLAEDCPCKLREHRSVALGGPMGIQRHSPR